MRCLNVALLLFCTTDTFLCAENEYYNPEFWEKKILLFDPVNSPTLEFICLKKSRYHGRMETVTSSDDPFAEIIDIELDKNFSSTQKSYLSNIRSDIINQWLVKYHLENIDLQLSLRPFLKEQSYKIEKFLEKQQQVEFEKIVAINTSIEEQNLSSPIQLSKTEKSLNKKKSPNEQDGEFTKFALYLLIGGGVCLIYAVLAPTVGKSLQERKKEKIELARRKRLLERMLQNDWIDQKTYEFLLTKIKVLPDYLKSSKNLKIHPQSLDLLDEEVDSSVALSKRNKGD